MAPSLNRNILLTVIKTVLSLAFPLITFPYVCRVLSPEGIGEYNYANSIISYFVLIASLGIGVYAIREGAKIRNNTNEYNKFGSEILILNISTTLLSYIALFLFFCIFEEFQIHYKAIIICSIQILFNTIGVEWVFSTFEDYLYITIRTLAFQFLSLVLLFTFVHDESDVYIYILISVIASVGANMYNIFYARKYVRFSYVNIKTTFKHLPPSIVIFSTTLATVIYVNSDITMLGWMQGTEQVGYYTVATKLYTIIKCTLNAIVPVFLARLSFEYEHNPQLYYKEFNYAFDLLTLFTLPLAVGAFFYSRFTIILLSGPGYVSSEPGMKILFVSNIFATWGNLVCSGALLQMRREKLMLVATTSGALINIVLNLFMIPKYGCTGAAITTLMTETIVLLMLAYFSREVIREIKCMHLLKCLISTLPIIVVGSAQAYLGLNDAFGYNIGCVFLCVFLYFMTLLLIRDQLIHNYINQLIIIVRGKN